MARYEDFSVGKLTVRAITAPTEGIAPSVTQGTSRSTAVTSNGYQGTIVTHNASLAASAGAVFQVNNNKVNANSLVFLSQSAPSATGFTLFSVTTIADGSFQITQNNVHTATADTNASTIKYYVVNGNP